MHEYMHSLVYDSVIKVPLHYKLPPPHTPDTYQTPTSSFISINLHRKMMFYPNEMHTGLHRGQLLKNLVGLLVLGIKFYCLNLINFKMSLLLLY